MRPVVRSCAIPARQQGRALSYLRPDSRQGFRVLRVWNHQVLTEPDGVPEVSFPLTLALSRQGRGEREE